MNLQLNPELMQMVRWSSRGSCGASGCNDPECVCALCAKPIGVPDNDPRWHDHDYQTCFGCELCEDDAPLMLFRGEGKDTKQAHFHSACFRRLCDGNRAACGRPS
jgi:hypothetical protein